MDWRALPLLAAYVVVSSLGGLLLPSLVVHGVGNVVGEEPSYLEVVHWAWSSKPVASVAFAAGTAVVGVASYQRARHDRLVTGALVGVLGTLFVYTVSAALLLGFSLGVRGAWMFGWPGVAVATLAPVMAARWASFEVASGDRGPGRVA